MNRWITTTKLLVTSLALLAAAVTIGYEMIYVRPARVCEEKGAWWDPKDRECLAPDADLAHHQPATGSGRRQKPLSPPR